MDEDLAKQLSSILSEHNIDLQKVMENFKANSSEESTSSNQDDSNQIDTKTLLKLQKILSLLNQKNNSSDEQLLLSLKPYLRESKKTKIDKYIKILHILKLLENFQEMGGDINDLL